jgi:hypothetical protein
MFAPHAGTHGIEGKVGPRAGLVSLKREKSLAPAEFRSPARPTHSVVTILTELPRLLPLSGATEESLVPATRLQPSRHIRNYTARTMHCAAVGKPQRLAVPIAEFRIRIFGSCVFPEYFSVNFRNGKPCMISRSVRGVRLSQRCERYRLCTISVKCISVQFGPADTHSCITITLMLQTATATSCGPYWPITQRHWVTIRTGHNAPSR